MDIGKHIFLIRDRMDIVKLLTKIYFDTGDVPNHIVSFYEKENISNVTDINAEKFVKICEKYFILNEPSILFQFLDFMNIKVAIFPVVNSDEWCYRIYDGREIIIMNEFTSRNEATLGAIELAFYLYQKKLKKTEKNGN